MTREEQIVNYAKSFKWKGVESEELKETLRLAIIAGAVWADRHPIELPSEDLEEEIKRYEASLPESATVDPFEGHPTLKDIARHFAEWQKSKDESRRMANIQLANTDTPVDTEMEVAFNDIWRDAELIVVIDGTLNEKATKSMKAVCHDFFESGKEWQKQQMLKEAVEGKVVENYGCEKGEDGEWRGVITPTIRIEAADFSIGDKLKVIVVKED